MARNYVQEVLDEINEVNKVKSELGSVKKQIGTVEDEYETQIREFREARDKKLNPLEKRRDELEVESSKKRNEIVNAIVHKFREYSFFNEDIFPYIVKLMSLVEGKKHDFRVECRDVCKIWCYDKHFLVQDEQKKVLEVKSYFILYYDIDFEKPVLRPAVDFGKYTYVIAYLDAIMNYRIDNNLRAPMGEEFERMALTVLKQFISDNLEFIRMKHQERMAEMQTEMNAIDEMLCQGDINVGRK